MAALIPPPDRRRRFRTALVSALPAVAVVRMALWLLPFRMIRRHVASIRPRAVSVDPAHTRVDDLVRAVRASSRLVPRATCLTQAIVLHYLLARRGRGSRIQIGVRRGGSGRFEAHAWVELDGKVVIGGGEDLSSFVPLLELQEAGR